MSVYIPTERHFREVLLFLFNSKESANGSHRMLLETYGEYSPSIKTCEYWFGRFESGDFDTADKDNAGKQKKNQDSNKRQRVRAGEPQFSCPHCDKAFIQQGKLKHHMKKIHNISQYDDLSRINNLYTVGQVEILNPTSNLLEEPPLVRREDLIPPVNKRLALDENESSTGPLMKRSKGSSLNSIALPKKGDNSMKSTEDYNITNMPFGDLENLIKSENEQCDTLSNLGQGDIIEPLVEIKVEHSD